MRPISRWSAVLGLALLLARAAVGVGQEITPKVLIAPQGLNTLANNLATQVQALAQLVATNAGRSEADRALLSDTRELAQATAEFRDLVNKDPELFRVRRTYAGIDHSWHH